MNAFSDALYVVKHRHGDRGENKISLTFDDGPSLWTPKFLSILDEFNIKATFFVIPQNVRALPDIVRDIVNRGHELGAHVAQNESFNFFKAISGKVDEAAIDDAISAIHEVTGLRARLFRPSPPMAFNRGLGSALKKRELFCVLASAYSHVHKPAGTKLVEIVKDIKNGSIILIHDGHDIFIDSDRPSKALRILPTIIRIANLNEHSFVKISDLIGRKPYVPPHNPRLY